jgi:tellurite resistance protein TerC
MVLVFVGVKMLASDFYHMPASLSLGIVISILVTTIVASLFKATDEENVPVDNAIESTSVKERS